MDSLVLLWIVAERGNKTTPLKAPVQGESSHFHLINPVLLLHLHFDPFSLAEAACQPQLVGLQLPAASQRRAHRPGCSLQCLWHSVSGTCSPGAVTSRGPSWLTLSKAHERGCDLCLPIARPHAYPANSVRCLQDNIQASGKATVHRCCKNAEGHV